MFDGDSGALSHAIANRINHLPTGDPGCNCEMKMVKMGNDDVKLAIVTTRDVWPGK